MNKKFLKSLINQIIEELNSDMELNKINPLFTPWLSTNDRGLTREYAGETQRRESRLPSENAYVAQVVLGNGNIAELTTYQTSGSRSGCLSESHKWHIIRKIVSPRPFRNLTPMVAGISQ